MQKQGKGQGQDMVVREKKKSPEAAGGLIRNLE